MILLCSLTSLKISTINLGGTHVIDLSIQKKTYEDTFPYIPLLSVYTLIGKEGEYSQL